MFRTASRSLLRLSALAVFACAALALVPALAAAQITVNTTADQAPSVGECTGVPGDCSLRQAIDAANKVPGPETIVLPAGSYTLTIKGSEENEERSCSPVRWTSGELTRHVNRGGTAKSSSHLPLRFLRCPL